MASKRVMEYLKRHIYQNDLLRQRRHAYTLALCIFQVLGNLRQDSARCFWAILFAATNTLELTRWCGKGSSSLISWRLALQFPDFKSKDLVEVGWHKTEVNYVPENWKQIDYINHAINTQNCWTERWCLLLSALVYVCVCECVSHRGCLCHLVTVQAAIPKLGSQVQNILVEILIVFRATHPDFQI